jgi:hypothetical protein
MILKIRSLPRSWRNRYFGYDLYGWSRTFFFKFHRLEIDIFLDRRA